MDEEAGTIEIPTDGLYLVYAQVFIILSFLNPLTNPPPKNPNFNLILRILPSCVFVYIFPLYFSFAVFRAQTLSNPPYSQQISNLVSSALLLRLSHHNKSQVTGAATVLYRTMATADIITENPKNLNFNYDFTCIFPKPSFQCMCIISLFQIEYLDVHDTNGFEINVDDEATMSCVTSTLGQDEETKKHNTCHTSGVLFLQRGNQYLFFKDVCFIFYHC